MKRNLVPPFVALLILVAPAAWASPLQPRPGSVVLHSTDFETNPLTLGWGSNAPLSEMGNAWTTAAAFSPVHSIRAIDSLWYSPIIPVTTFELYAARFRAYASNEGYAGAVPNYKFAYSLDPWAQNVLLFRGEANDASETQVVFQPPAGGWVYVDDVSIERLDPPAAAAVLDGWISAQPAFTFTAETQRHAHLTRTKGLLSQGQTVRVVMLGDSIVNDTSHSYFEPLVERLYPGSRMEIVTSVRGATGCWWYREDDPITGQPRVKEWVLDHDPDLLIIGGISHGADLAYEIDSFRSVIDAVRSVNPAIEVLLLTEAAGYINDPYHNPLLVAPLNPQGDDWRARLYRLAQEEQVEFLDLTYWWAQYLLHSGHPDAWFKRDAIHMNHRGSVVVGQALVAYFAPTSPDADQDGMPDVTDRCPSDPLNDVDFDGLCAAHDADDDGDGVADASDCAPEDALAWSVPGEVSACNDGDCLRLTRAGAETVLQWNAPTGGTVFWYDVLRTSTPSDFVNPSYVESNDGTDREARDSFVPTPGKCFYYLVRARNVLGDGPASPALARATPSLCSTH
jgi:hypothetical protein